MARRPFSLRWVVFLAGLFFLVRSVFGEATRWTLGGFFACLGLWYWLTWLKTRELDSPRPR